MAKSTSTSRFIIPVLIFLSTFFVALQAEELIFCAFGNRNIQPRSNYEIKIFSEPLTKTGFVDPIYITFSITCRNGRTRHNTTSFRGDPINIIPGSVQSGIIAINTTVQNGYNRCVINSDLAHWGGRLHFKKEKPGQNIELNKIILCQTDKPVYKPGDTIKFRVLILDNKWKPIPGQNITVKIMDSENNLIKLWKNEPVHLGMFSNSFVLSHEPNLGSWHIMAEVGLTDKKISITVDKYILPKFKVELIHPAYVVKDNYNITVEIRGFYTYGKEIEGQVTLELNKVNSNPRWRWTERDPNVRYNTYVLVHGNLSLSNGICNIEVDLENEGGRYLPPSRKFLLRANITNTVTGIVRSVTSSIIMYNEKYKIRKLNQEIYKPGFPVKLKLQVLTPDEKPVYDSNPKALKVTGCYNNSEPIDKYFPITQNGIVIFSCDTIAEEPSKYSSFTRFKLNVFFNDFHETVEVSKKYVTASKVHMKISIPDKNYVMGKNVTVNIMTNKPSFKYLNYFLLNHGKFVASSRKEISKVPVSSAILSFNLPFLEKPDNCKLILTVFFREFSTNEIIMDKVVINLKKSNESTNLKNKALNLTMSTKICKPGENILLSFNAPSVGNSTILAIRAVDQSALLLSDKDNDITKSILPSIKGDNSDFSDFQYDSAYINMKNDLGHIGLKVLLDRKSNELFDQKCVKKAKRLGSLRRSGSNKYRGPISGFGGYKEAVDSESYLNSKVRKFFPETWLWTEMEINNVTTEITTSVPDTITSWVITAFSLNFQTGLSVMSSPQILTTFKPFFVSLNLPYAVIRKKPFALQVLIHNYLGTEILVNVTLENPKNHFNFVDSREIIERKSQQTVHVPANQVISTNIIISPSKLNSINVNVSATVDNYFDAVIRELKVIPEGIRKSITENILIDLTPERNFMEQNYTINFPRKRVKGADQIKMNVVGDIIGISLESLEHLIQLPTGCGEQNMLNFVPDIVMLHYLKTSEQLTSPVKERLLKYLEIGYSRQLTFRHADGSFSVFGKRDPRGSTWLTAFVMKSFAWASKYITIDEKVLVNGVKFLISQQDSITGEIFERGTVFHSSLKGGSGSKGVALTAYVTSAFLEISQLNIPKIANLTLSLSLGQKFISDQSVLHSGDKYAIILSAYTLQKARHASRDVFFHNMESLATTTENSKYWKQSADAEKSSSPLSIEMTAYAILNYVSRNDLAGAGLILKWLLAQRNSQGGFKSTQDTVVAITALTAFATKTSHIPPSMAITADTKDYSKQFFVNEDNRQLQEYKFKDSIKSYKISATGNGTALAQITSTYYVHENAEDETSFIVTSKSKKTSKVLQLNVCVRATFTEKTDMALVEISMPVSYEFYKEDVEDLVEGKIKRVEVTSGGSTLYVYYEYLTSKDSCFNVSAEEKFAMADLDSVVIKVDEYNGSHNTTQVHKITKKTICEICIETNACDVRKCK